MRPSSAGGKILRSGSRIAFASKPQIKTNTWYSKLMVVPAEGGEAVPLGARDLFGDDERLQPLNVPILGLFAEKDTGIKVESVQAFAAALERLRKPHDIHIYPGVRHAFANPTGNAYDAKAADDAWQKTLQFLQDNLVESDPASD